MKRTSIILAIAMALLFVIAGCTSTGPAATATSGTVTSGSITVAGSTAMQPLAQEAASEFMAKYSGASISVQGGGSGTGLTQVASGAVNIGNSDVFAAEKLASDQAALLVDHKICVVGFAAVVSPDVTITNLTSQQLIDVFTGKITNWKDVGGVDQKIVIINRPASSGTRASFKKYALNGADESTGLALTEDSNGTVRTTVATTKGSISYLALSYIDNTVKALQLNGVVANAANITTGAYTVWSYEHSYTKGEATGLSKSFIDFMMSADFAAKITQLGYIPISSMKVPR
jgi:phosphate transport system substrate-binding protein